MKRDEIFTFRYYLCAKLVLPLMMLMKISRSQACLLASLLLPNTHTQTHTYTHKETRIMFRRVFNTESNLAIMRLGLDKQHLVCDIRPIFLSSIVVDVVLVGVGVEGNNKHPEKSRFQVLCLWFQQPHYGIPHPHFLTHHFRGLYK